MSPGDTVIATPDCFLLVDPARDIVYASAAAESVLGWMPSDLVSRSIFELLPDFVDGPAGSPVTRVLAGRTCPATSPVAAGATAPSSTRPCRCAPCAAPAGRSSA